MKYSKEQLIQDIKNLFDKYDLYLSKEDIYGGRDTLSHSEYEIVSRKFTNNKPDIELSIKELGEYV